MHIVYIILCIGICFTGTVFLFCSLHSSVYNTVHFTKNIIFCGIINFVICFKKQIRTENTTFHSIIYSCYFRICRCQFFPQSLTQKTISNLCFHLIKICHCLFCIFPKHFCFICFQDINHFLQCIVHYLFFICFFNRCSRIT